VLQRGRETSLEHASGLGLWLVHWIVTESGGSVSFEEREPRGSVVELTLPRTEPVEPDDDAAADEADDGADVAGELDADGPAKRSR
jgi:K+-sensing histidine kinase KdpD